MQLVDDLQMMDVFGLAVGAFLHSQKYYEFHYQFLYLFIELHHDLSTLPGQPALLVEVVPSDDLGDDVLDHLVVRVYHVVAA